MDKIDEDVFLIKWERFKIKCHNRMIFNLSEMELLFRVWLQLTMGDLIA